MVEEPKNIIITKDGEVGMVPERFITEIKLKTGAVQEKQML